MGVGNLISYLVVLLVAVSCWQNVYLHWISFEMDVFAISTEGQALTLLQAIILVIILPLHAVDNQCLLHHWRRGHEQS